MRTIIKASLASAVLLACVSGLGYKIFQARTIAATVKPTFSTPACPKPTRGQVQCHAAVVSDARTRMKRTSRTPSGYGPTQFRTAYNLPHRPPTPQTVYIVDAFDAPNIEQDLKIYSAAFGLPPCTTANGCFTKIKVGNPAYNAGWEMETSLDVQIVHALCKRDCKIVLIEANSNSYADMLAAIDKAVSLGATIVSNSWGSGEFSSQTSSSIDGHFNHPGVVFTFSSGDAGYGVAYPAASKYVTAVGGTTLTLNADNTRASETAWSGSGSGCSLYESKPTWQKDTGCSNRTVADVSAAADPATGAAIYNSNAGGWLKVGGTSLAAPIIASIYALAGNASATNYGSYPYAHKGRFFDVTSGTNGTCSPAYLCSGVTGFDGPTGLGAPVGRLGF
ncbi:MAG TPA: S53 family peptidase [Stenomitos sp.]